MRVFSVVFSRPFSALRQLLVASLLFGPGLMGVSGAVAQPSQPRPSFEVASVKLSPGDRDRVMVGVRVPGTFTAEHSTLRNLIRAAYDVRAFQVIGGPSWIDRDRYDVTAKPRVEAPPPQGDEWPEMALMLQSLLEERFKLRLHRETRDVPVFILVTAEGTSKLQHKDGSCRSDTTTASGPTTFCGSSRMGQRGENRTIEGAGIRMADLVRALATATGREVIDRTDFTGTFDAHLEWTPDNPTLGARSSATPDSVPAAADATGASLSTALREQLGLRLRAGMSPLSVLVIDHVERAEPD